MYEYEERLAQLQQQVNVTRSRLQSARSKDETVVLMGELETDKGHLSDYLAKLALKIQITPRTDDSIYQWDPYSPAHYLPMKMTVEEALKGWFGLEPNMLDTGLYELEDGRIFLCDVVEGSVSWISTN